MKTYHEFIKEVEEDKLEEELPTYTDFIADQLDKSIDYSSYLAEQIDKSLDYTSYLAESLEKVYSGNNVKYTNTGSTTVIKLFAYDSVADPGFSNARMTNPLSVREYINIPIDKKTLFDHLEITSPYTDKLEEQFIGNSRITGQSIYRKNNEFYIKVLFADEKAYLINRIIFITEKNESILPTLELMNQILNENEIENVLKSLPLRENIKSCYITSARTYADNQHGIAGNVGISGTSGISGNIGISGSSGVSGKSGYTDGYDWYMLNSSSGYKPGKQTPFKNNNEPEEIFLGTSRITGLPMFRKGKLIYTTNEDGQIKYTTDFWLEEQKPNRNGRIYLTKPIFPKDDLSEFTGCIDHPDHDNFYERINFLKTIYRYIKNKLSKKKVIKEKVEIPDNFEFSEKFFLSLEEFKEFEKELEVLPINKENENKS